MRRGGLLLALGAAVTAAGLGGIAWAVSRKDQLVGTAGNLKRKTEDLVQDLTRNEDPKKPTSSSMAELVPDFRNRLERVLDRLENEGFSPKVNETFRSEARQALMFELGTSKTPKVGNHHWGRAADIVDGRKDAQGRVVLWGASLDTWSNAAERQRMADNFFAALGRAAKAEGLTWGGDWRSFPDPAHVELKG